MGLDQYAYVAMKAGAQAEYYEDENYDKEDGDPTKLSEPREIAYWRKHPNLQGWMERLWIERNPDAEGETGVMFNGIELELTWDDLERLESDVEAGTLPQTSGFFFGSDSDEYYQQQDLEFIKQAKFELFVGLRVFYNSSW
jgi:hypothetical protein